MDDLVELCLSTLSVVCLSVSPVSSLSRGNEALPGREIADYPRCGTAVGCEEKHQCLVSFKTKKHVFTFHLFI